MKIGLIGAGIAGERHAAALRMMAEARLIGLHDPDQRRAAGLSARFGAPTLDLDALLSESDAVIVATPASTHGRLSLQALAAGCHVLVERPIATARHEARDMIAQARAAKRILHVGHREAPTLAGLGLSAGLPGLRHLEAVREAPPREHSADVSVIFDLMIQDIFVAVVLFGAPAVSVRATKLGGRGSAIDAAEARIRFKGGGEARLRATRTASIRTTQWAIETGRGKMDVDFVRGQVTQTAGWPDAKPFLAQDADPVAQKLAQFVAACEAPYQEPANQDALAAMDLALQIETILSANL